VRSRPILVVPFALLVALPSCQIPLFEGPEIQRPPPNFQRRPDSHPQRRVFPDREVTFHTAWVHTDLGGVSTIYVDEHPEALGVDDALAAREAARAAERDPDALYGEIEVLSVDERQGWGWFRRVESPRRGLEQVTYTAVVPYDTVSYALMFTSGEPSLKRAAPDTLRAIISSFGIGRTTYNLPLIAIVAGALLLLIGTFRARSRERDRRARSITLKTIPKDDTEGGGRDRAGGAGRVSGSSPPSASGTSAPERQPPPGREARPRPPTSEPPGS